MVKIFLQAFNKTEYLNIQETCEYLIISLVIMETKQIFMIKNLDFPSR